MVNPEKAKYDAIYLDGAIPGYGSSNHGERFLCEAGLYQCVIDIGCGDNSFINQLKERFTPAIAVGADLSHPDADYVIDITQDHAVSGRYDLATAFDVMEHLRPSQVDQALENISRISDKFLFTISFRESMHTVNGEPLHMTVESPGWWLDKLHNYADFILFETFSEDDGIFRGAWK